MVEPRVSAAEYELTGVVYEEENCIIQRMAVNPRNIVVHDGGTNYIATILPHIEAVLEEGDKQFTEVAYNAFKNGNSIRFESEGGSVVTIADAPAAVEAIRDAEADE